MPLPMVHLSVAVSLCEKEGYFPSPDFLLGSIAPDAIHMRPNTGERDKERVHLLELGASPRELAGLFKAQYGPEGFQSLGFSEGYLAHLLTDRLWWEAVFSPFRKKLPPTLPEKNVRSLYYRDTDQVDLDLYLQSPWRPDAWARLKKATAAGFPLFLAAEEVTQWRDRTLLWYEDPRHEPGVEPVYITRMATQVFIERAATEIAGIFADLKEHIFAFSSDRKGDHKDHP
jgi:hypothetical protein